MSDCNVCLGGNDFDFAWDFEDTRTVKARKVHKCSECREPIAIGQKYNYTAAVGDGDFYTYKTCLLCEELRAAFSCDGYICHGMLWEEITEILFPDMTTGCLEKLQTAEAKAFLVKRWNEWKFRAAQRAPGVGEAK